MVARPLLTVWPLSGASQARTEISLEELYDRHADYVYQSLRRLGVPTGYLADALQDVFVILHRRLSELDASGSVKPWLFVLAVGVARNQRRTMRRRAPEYGGDGARVDPDALGGRVEEPLERAAHAEQVQLFYKLLDTMDDDKRAVFVLAELEQLTVPEIAATLSLNVNTAYARLRAARQKFDQALTRFRAREHRGSHR